MREGKFDANGSPIPDPGNEPYTSWIIPTKIDGEGNVIEGNSIQQRDLLIVDQNNRFLAFQNLLKKGLDNASNREIFKNFILETTRSAVSDSDIDGIPDPWELDFVENIDVFSTDITESNQPLLLSYAFSGDPKRYLPSAQPRMEIMEIGKDNFPSITYRRRLGGEGQRLKYIPEMSSDGVTWNAEGFLDVDVTDPYDGTGTEFVTVRRDAAVATDGSPPAQFFRVRVELPEFEF